MLIDVVNFTFAYEGSHDNIFENVRFQIDSDWRLGFTGRNGRGKTTFLRCLTGELAYSGTISAPGLTFSYFPVGIEDMEEATLPALLRAAPEAEEWELLRELNLLEIPDNALERPFRTLSSGEQTRAALATLFLRDGGFALIDEPTNHLDMEARELVGEYLRRKRGFILVSHDRALLDRCTDHTLSINRADIQVVRGGFSTWWENKRRQDEFELAENEKLRQEIGRLKETAREKADWSDRLEATKIGMGAADRGAIGAKAARMMKRSKAIEGRRERAIEEKSKLLKNLDRQEDLKLAPLAYRAERLLELRDVTISYGDDPVCTGVTMEVKRGERIALTGRNGSGKSSILKLILGEDILHTGQVSVGSGLKISYVRQDTSDLAGTLHDYAVSYGIDESVFLSILRKLGFERVQFEKPLEDFSAGQKKKVLIARSLCEQAHLYIWDEPLNYIDVISRMQIEDLIGRFAPTMLFVEHDRAFCETLATRTVDLT